MLPNIVIPQVPGPKLAEPSRRWCEQYTQQRYERESSGFKVENVRFEHDPNWRNAFWSLQGVRDGTNGVSWKIVKVMFVAGSVFGYSIGITGR